MAPHSKEDSSIPLLGVSGAVMEILFRRVLKGTCFMAHAGKK